MVEAHSVIKFNLPNNETVNLIRYVYGLCLSSVFGGCLGVSIGQLYVLFSDRKVFPMWGFDPLVKAVAVKAYTLGLSLRQVAVFLGGMGFSVSRESVRRWFLKAGEVLSGGGVGRRGFIAVDEAVTCLGGLIYGLPGM